MDLMALILACAPLVHPQTMAHIVEAESGGNRWAIHVNGDAGSITGLEGKKAIATAKKYIESGTTVDVGLAQINSANFDWLGLTVKEAFDPCKNLHAAQTILVSNYERAKEMAYSTEGALDMALSMYNTGDPQDGQKNGYVRRVRTANPDYKVPALSAKLRAKAPSPVKVRVKARTQKQRETHHPSWDIFGDITNRKGRTEWQWLPE